MAGNLCLSTYPAQAFPQFEQWISKKAGFQTNCAYCHLNAAGPLGNGNGQEGALTDQQRSNLHTKDSPILNEFGQHLIARLSYQKVVSSVEDPQALALVMKAYDLDGDGVPDGEEMLHGTLPQDPLSAPPGLIWSRRLKDNSLFLWCIWSSAIVAAIGFWRLSTINRSTVSRADDDDSPGGSV